MWTDRWTLLDGQDAHAPCIGQPHSNGFYRASAVAASPVLATIGMSVRLSVRPSVRPSHADIV